MRFRKLAAGVLAAAMAVVSLPQVVSAVDFDYSFDQFKVGDVFFVPFDPDTGDVIGEPTTNEADGVGDKNAAYKCKVLSDETIGTVTHCSGDENEYIHRSKSITIPDTISGYTVTQIGGSYDQTWDIRHCLGGFASITIPDTVTTIEMSGFSNNVLLEEIHFGVNSQLKLIGNSAFRNCSSLKSITIPAGVETIDGFAFQNNNKTDINTYISSLETVKFAEGSKLKEIGAYAFEHQTALTSIELPNSVEEMGHLVFSGCTSLSNVKLSEGLKKWGYGIFTGCNALKSITIPAGIDDIPTLMFGSGLINIYVDENNKTFKSVDGVVYSKDGTELVAYPTGRSAAFVIPEGVTKARENVCEGAHITSLTVPSTLTELPYCAFSYCIDLTEVNLPETLTSIGEWAFQETGFTSITIPASVKEIAANAFEGSKLKTIYGVEGSYAETFAKKYGYAFNDEPVEGTVTDNETGISVSGAVPEGAQLNAALDTENSTNTKLVYNISLTKDGSEVQPNSTVTVKIPVPEEFKDKAAELKVYHLVDGKYTDMNAKLEEGYLVFETDHFSVYVVTPDVIADVTPDTPDDTTGTESAPDTPPDMGIVIAPVTTAAETTPAESGTFTDEKTGIEVVVTSGAVSEGAQLNVAPDTENSSDTRLAYNISFSKDGAEVQPNGAVTVKIPVPEKFKDKAAKLKVYHLIDGRYADMNAKLEGGYLVFTTNHFSVYVVTPDVIPEKSDVTTGTESAPVNTDNGSVNTTQPVSTDNGAANVGNIGGNSNKDPNPDTGSSIAIVPVIVAAAAVSFFAYKRKK